MGSLSSFNHGVKYLLFVIDVFTKHAWVKLLTDKNSKTALDSFIGLLNESKCKPNKSWVVQGSEFNNNLKNG